MSEIHHSVFTPLGRTKLANEVRTAETHFWAMPKYSTKAVTARSTQASSKRSFRATRIASCPADVSVHTVK